jgi:DNA-binding response OmpR family regulator
MRVLIVEDEPYMAEAIRDGLRLEAIAADIAGDGDTALELMSVNDYDIAVLDRDIPGPTGDEIAKRIVSERSTAGAPTTGRLCERSQVCGWIRSAARSTATNATSR